MSKKSKRKNMYDNSLSEIFIYSGLDVFVTLFIIAFVMFAILLVYRRDAEVIKIILFTVVAIPVVSYGPSLISLFKVHKLEKDLGIYWNDRKDNNVPELERDWFFKYVRGGFVILHRDYIKNIVSNGEYQSYTGRGGLRETIYYLIFEDIKGKNHKVKFSSKSDMKKVYKWYKSKKYE